jgi:3-phenylpropionate/trans-cinnamate dioxygenase ferredoxin subunit
MARLVKVADTNQLPPGKATAVELDGTRIAVFNVGGTFYALEDTCPHAGGPLSEGRVDGDKVVCPWHDAAFDLKTGDVLSPPAFEGVKSYKVVVEGNDVKVELKSE